jgi:hypothetical protein
MPRPRKTDIQVAATLLDRSEPIPMAGCRIWTGTVDSRGYGVVKLGKRMFKAHRLMYRFFKGPCPDNLFVLHRCDTPSCVNVEHLFLGTADDNMQDKTRKGRHRCPSGSAHYRTNLTSEQVLAIRRRWAQGERSGTLLPDFPTLSRSVLSAIVLRKTWKQL